MFASLKYEQLPYFCSHCGIIGHSLESCRSLHGRKEGANQGKIGNERGYGHDWELCKLTKQVIILWLRRKFLDKT